MAGLVIVIIKVTTLMFTTILVGEVEVEVVLVVAIKMTERLWAGSFLTS